MSSDWKLRIGITNQLGAYVLRYPAAIAGLRANGFRPEYFGYDHAFFADLFEIAQMPEDQWNRRLAELKLIHPAEYSKYLRLGEHLPALSSDELAEYFIPLAGIIQPNPAPVEIDIEPTNSHTILEQEPPPAPLQSSPIEIDEQSPAAQPAIVERQPPEPAGEERAPALQHDFVGHTVTPEHRLIGLIVKHRVPAADIQLKPEHFHDPDLRYTWKRWERLGSEVDQLEEDAIRARTDQWARFAVWLIDEAGASDSDNPTNPETEIAALAKQIRNEEPAATDVVEILPPVPAAAPPEIVEEITPAPPVVEEASPPAPSCPTSSDNGHSDFVGFDVSEPPLPLDRASQADIEARNLQAALDLAVTGIPIFPARLKWEEGKWRKRPIISGWQAVSADPERVRGWWRMHPEAVPGIPLGRPGLVVIDADRHPGAPDGVVGPWTIQRVADFISYSANPRASRLVTAKASSPGAASM